MHTREISVGGRTISLETGRLAKQADGAVVVRSGDTVVLVTACAAANPREGIDFLPLTVDYREYTYASGRIPGGFFKREGKPSREGSSHQPPDRSAHPAALSVGLAARDAGHRPASSRPTPTTIPTCWPSPVRRRRWLCRRFPSRKRLRGSGSARSTASSSSIPRSISGAAAVSISWWPAPRTPS